MKDDSRRRVLQDLELGTSVSDSRANFVQSNPRIQTPPKAAPRQTAAIGREKELRRGNSSSWNYRSYIISLNPACDQSERPEL